MRKVASGMQASGYRLPDAALNADCRHLLPAKKSDKNLHLPENLVYYIQEMRKRNLPRCIRRIRRRVRSFLCFKAPLSLPAAGLSRFADVLRQAESGIL